MCKRTEENSVFLLKYIHKLYKKYQPVNLPDVKYLKETAGTDYLVLSWARPGLQQNLPAALASESRFPHPGQLKNIQTISIL